MDMRVSDRMESDMNRIVAGGVHDGEHRSWTLFCFHGDTNGLA